MRCTQESWRRWAEYFKELFEIEVHEPPEIDGEVWDIGEDDQEELPTKQEIEG